MSNPRTLADFESYVSGLINDPTNSRYSLSLIDSQLDIAQHHWNLEAKICRITDNIALSANVYRYAFSAIFSANPIALLRVTHMGKPVTIRSKGYFDQYSASDWTTVQGTPRDICIDLNSNNTLAGQNGPSIILHPTPQSSDVLPYSNSVGISSQNPLTIEYLSFHTPMVNPTDTPFFVNSLYSNNLIIPYLSGLGLEAAAGLLEPDPTAETDKKAQVFRAQANTYLSLVIQMYEGLEQDAPARMKGGRAWQLGGSGNPQ